VNYAAVTAAVNASAARGLCVVPPSQDGSKKPGVPSWKEYQETRPTRAVLDRWYSIGRTGIGWICGAVSGGLEVVEFDDRSVYVEFKKLAIASGLGDLIDLIEKGYLEHSPNGVHWPYFCQTVAGNTKLAKRKVDGGWKSLIETRGEGGYIIVAPTFGSVNASGAYELVSGGIDTIEVLTVKERDALHDLARVFDESPKQVHAAPSSAATDDRPGDNYASRVSWGDLLTKHGWAEVYRRLDVTAWRRPGKKHGVSATTNYEGSDLLYVFSTSTPFESERGYNKFSAYALLEHAGDYTAAARELHLLGYGDEPTTHVDISGILASREHEPEPGFPAELLRVPGMVGDLADYINTTSVKAQPVLALAASIAAVATVIGRKVRTDNRLRPNIYILGVAETGAGKERARQAVRQVFQAAGAGQRTAFDDMASDAAILTAVTKSPSCLLLLDEIGRTLKELSSARSPGHITKMVSVYLKIYGSSDGVFYSKTYADADRAVSVEQPCLSIYGTTVPSRLYESMTTAQISDGFLSRFLIFESADPDPLYVDVFDDTPPDDLVASFRAWEKRSVNANPAAGNIEQLRPDPLVVPVTSRGRAVFADLEADMYALRKRMREGGDDPGMYTRVAATAQKLALIRACGIAFEQPEITEADAVWGARLALYLYDQIVRKITVNVSDNATEAVTKRVAAVIRKTGDSGITKTALTRKTQWLTRHERNDIMATLQDSGQVVAAVADNKRVTYHWTENACQRKPK